MQPIATRPRPSRRRVPGDAAGAADDGRSESTVDAGSRWTARPWVPPTERADAGKAARKQTPRTTHAAFQPAPDRDPIGILGDQESDRLPELLPLRHQRMAESAFAYYRGTPAVMAFDLASTPRSNILVQASGDAHISNFGLFASPERSLVFDANDFDETLPGPWEWDVKRLATSVTIAGRSNGFSAAVNRDATMAGTRSYRQWMARYAGMRLIDVLYASITADHIREAAEASGGFARGDSVSRRRRLEAIFSKARQRDGMRAFESLTGVVDGRRVLLDDPPVVTHIDLAPIGGTAALEKVFTDYRASMPEDRRAYLERYRFVDVALKVVGVGSVGTRCFILVLEGRDENDPLMLQAKEATVSVIDAASRGDRPHQPGPTGRHRPADHAGDLGRLPRLDARPGRSRLLCPPAVGYEGLCGHRPTPGARSDLLRHGLRLGAGTRPRSIGRCGGDRGVPRHE